MPNYIIINPHIIVDQYIPGTGNYLPLYLGILILKLYRNLLHSFANDLQASDNCPAKDLIIMQFVGTFYLNMIGNKINLI